MSVKRFVDLNEIGEINNLQDRFTFISNEQLERKIEGRHPKNTARSTNWTVKLWDEWAEARNRVQRNTGFPKIPFMDEINSLTEVNLEQFLCRFVFEIRKKNGQPYPPNSILVIVAGIQRYMRENGKPGINILEKSDGKFHKFHGALDARLKELTAQGVGIETRQASEITSMQESTLWEKGIISLDTPVGLSNAIFFYTSKVFGLRSGDEHRALKFSQFTVGQNENGKFIQFQGQASKTKNGGLNSLKRDFKKVIQYEDENNPRSYYKIFTLYKSCLPNECSAFYYKPIRKEGNELSFSGINVVGKNSLDKYVSNMMKEAGFKGFYTNHSIKATLCTNLYSKGYDEQSIAERSGHISSANRKYIRTTDHQHKIISNELDPPRPPKPTKTSQDLELSFAEKDEISEIEELVKTSDQFFNDDIFLSQMDSVSTSKQVKTPTITPEKKRTPRKEMDIKTPVKSTSPNQSMYNLRKSPRTPKRHSVTASTAVVKKLKVEETQASCMTTYRHKKYDAGRRQSITVFRNGIRETLSCDQCCNEQPSFELNFADFLPKDITIKPTNIKLEGCQTAEGGQLIVKIDY